MATLERLRRRYAIAEGRAKGMNRRMNDAQLTN